MDKLNNEKLKELIRTIPDFPEPGILFRDITTALKDKEGLKLIIDDFTERYKDKGIDYVLGADARGFIFGAAIAYNIGAGFVPARKVGKLPAETVRADYSLEYGKNSIEIHKDAFEKDANVLIVDDLLATGGTAKAMVELVEELGAKVYELAFLIELEDLNARNILEGKSVYSILKY
ncbi:adenine phosphoribosyltransferase [Pseudostreptobacillus hongkongensis]|uniref:adenine phosphoribosyltransferase n=1 Tax=Pseudostreptobacillus hongkongensis TaxID=1162717 RepID=UPI00083650C7|nr:adenine phosphoribosyltransferase [Pseudostreptobacillus hongkongensis]